MKTLLKLIVTVAGLLFAVSLYAQAPAGAPAGATGLCKDGSYFTGAKKQGACRGHQGVKDWYGSNVAPSKSTPAAAPASTSAAAPVPAAAPAAKPTAAKNTPPANAAPGGGPGLVWANEGTKVYHCQGDRWYGKTKQGQYMSEADAKAKGFHGDHGKGCQ